MLEQVQSKLFSKINLASLWNCYTSEVYPLPHELQSFPTRLEETWPIHSYVSIWNFLVYCSLVFLSLYWVVSLMHIQISTQPEIKGPSRRLSNHPPLSLPHVQYSAPQILAVLSSEHPTLWILRSVWSLHLFTVIWKLFLYI